MSSFEYINYNAKTGKWFISYEAGGTGDYFVPAENAERRTEEHIRQMKARYSNA